MTKQPASREDLIRARILSKDSKLVALYLPVDFKSGAYNYYFSSMRLFESMKGVPFDDRILAPALNLYRHAVELSLKSVFQRIHFEDGDVEHDKAFSKEMAGTFRHDLAKLLKEVEQIENYEQVPSDLKSQVRTLIEFFSEKHMESVPLRFGSDSNDDFDDSYSLVHLHGALSQSWVSLYSFVDSVVDKALSRRS